MCSFCTTHYSITAKSTNFVAYNNTIKFPTMRYSKALSDQRDEIQNLETKTLCKRMEETEIDLDSSLAQIVIGVRRSGKSTICQKVLVESGVIFAYVNFDDERLRGVQANDLNDILEELYRIYGSFTHLFLDEIQNVEAWPLFVNRLLRQRVRIVMTGSNANLLSSELITHMTGRYNLIELYPFSFAEYCSMTNVDTQKFTTKASGLRGYALNQYLQTGGFPEILQNARMSAKAYVQSLLRAIVEKDICRRYHVRYKQTIYDLANHILDWFCQEKSYNSIAKDLQIASVHTVRNYMGYLENAYLVRSIPKFSYKSIERNAARKYYATDMAFLAQRERALQTESLGWRLENVVAIELLRRMEYATEELYYLRESRSYEVDFAVVEQSCVTQLIQVTYDFTTPKPRLFNREIGGLVKGAKATQCNDLTLVMGSGDTHDIEVDSFIIHCVNAAEWLLNTKK